MAFTTPSIYRVDIKIRLLRCAKRGPVKIDPFKFKGIPCLLFILDGPFEVTGIYVA